MQGGGPRESSIIQVVGKTQVSDLLRSAMRPKRRSWVVCGLLVAVVAAGAQSARAAAVQFTLSGTAGIEHNTNARQRPDADSPSSGDRSDAAARLGVNLGLHLGGEGPLQATVRAGLLDADFNHFDTLNHRDHDVGAMVVWRPIELFDLNVDTSQTREPVNISDTGGVETTQQTVRRATGTLNLRPTPQWELGVSPIWSRTRTPLETAGDFELREDGGQLSIAFIGAGRWIPSISASRLEGRNYNIENGTRYRDRIIEGTLGIQATEASSFRLAIGQTRRSTSLVDSATDPQALAIEGSDSAITGSLDLFRRLTAKTSLNLTAYRRVQQYDAGINTAVSTGVVAGVAWAPTQKISVTLDGGFNWESIDDMQAGSLLVQRKDFVRVFAAGVTYAPMRRLSLRSYVSRNIRTSNVQSFRFNNTIVGLELTASVD